MTLTAILPDVPWPIASGGHLRDWQQLQLLRALGHHVRALAFTSPSRDLAVEDLRPLQAVVEELVTIPWADDGCRLRGPARAWQQLASIWPWHPGRVRRYGYLKERYPMAWLYDRADGGEQVAAWLKRWRPATVVLRSRLLHYLPLVAASGARVVIDAPDVHGWHLWENSRSERRPLQKVALGLQALTVFCHESWAYRDCHEIWVTSPTEAMVFRRLARGGPAVVVLPNLVDPQRYPLNPTGSSPTILFVGILSFPTNAEAADRLVSTIFPPVKRRVPGAQLWLVGAGAPRWLTARATQVGGVRLIGAVPDIRPYLEEAAVVAVPLRGVGGVPYKLIEAMAAAKAVVASPQAVAGIRATPGKHLVVARTPLEFAQAIARLLADPAARRRLGLAARALVEQTYSYAAGVEILRRRSRVACAS